MIPPFYKGRNRGNFKTEGAIGTDLPREHLRSPEEQTLAHRLPSSREFLLLVGPLEYSCWSLDHQSVRRLRRSGQDGILRDDAETRGWNGAALAAFGEMVVDFFGAEVPLPDRRDGVKLGESTLNRFLLLYMVAVKLFVADT